MAARQNMISIVLMSTAVGSTVIAVLAALLRRRRKKKQVTPKPDVLNEALPVDLSLQAEHGDRTLQAGDLDVSGNLSISQRSLSTISRVSSVGTLTNGNIGHFTVQQLCHLGNQHLQKAERLWEEALSKIALDNSNTQNASLEQLRALLVKVKDLQTLYQSEFESDVALDAALGALQEMDADYERQHGHSITSEEASMDSFVSAQETPDLSDLEERMSLRQINRLHLYDAGLKELQVNSVPYRKLRTKLVGCQSDSEFLAKLYALRLGLEEVMKVDANRKWFTETGKRIVSSIIVKAERDPAEFLSAMASMEAFLPVPANFEILQAELGTRGVKRFTLYDVVLDWMLMDAFDDLCNPPASVVSVVQNRWLSDGLKETAISTAVWSILKAKRRLLKYPDGFIAKFYAISESVSPILAWAFLGPETDVKTACQAFRTQCMGFIQDLFNQGKVRYTVYEEMVADIMKVARLRASNIISAIENTNNHLTNELTS